MLDDLRELWRYRELLLTMVKRDMRVRYKNSALGILWSLINPLMMMTVTWVVFIVFLDLSIHNYSAYYLAAFLPFSFIQVAILDSAQSILVAQPVVKKVYFPRELLPLSSVVGNFIHFLVGLGVLFAFLLGAYAISGFKEFPIQIGVIYLPFLLIITFCFTLGMSLIVSALNTFYEDVKYLATMMLYMLYFLCPIMYFVEMVANSPRMAYFHRIPWYLYNLNPITTICITYRKTLLAQIPIPKPNSKGLYFPESPLNWHYLLSTTLFSVVILVFGYHVFNQYKWRFMERP